MNKLTLLKSRCYSPKEVQAVLKVDIHIIYKWLKTGHLRALRVNNRWYIPEQFIDDMIHTNFDIDTI